MTISKCKGCGFSVVWIKTTGGKAMPCDPGEIEIDLEGAKTTTIVTNDGRLEFGSPINKDDLFPPARTAKGRISHFATCPAANKFRKGER